MFGAVDEGRYHRGGEEADQNQNGTGNPGSVFGVAVGTKNLVDEGGESVEVSNKQRKGEENGVERWGAEDEFADGLEERNGLFGGRGGGGWGRWVGRNENRGKCRDSGDDGDIEHHLRHIGRLGDPGGIY